MLKQLSRGVIALLALRFVAATRVTGAETNLMAATPSLRWTDKP